MIRLGLLENSPNPGRAARSVFNLDGGDHRPGAASGNPLQIGCIFDLIASGTVEDVMDQKIGGKSIVRAQGVDADSLDRPLFHQKAGSLS